MAADKRKWDDFYYACNSDKKVSVLPGTYRAPICPVFIRVKPKFMSGRCPDYRTFLRTRADCEPPLKPAPRLKSWHNLGGWHGACLK